MPAHFLNSVTAFKSLIELSRDPYYVVMPTTGFRLVYANDAVLSFIGYSLAEMLEMTIPDWDPSVTLAGLEELWRELKQQQRLVVEKVVRTSTGTIIPVEVTMNYLVIDRQEFMAGYFKDISERNALRQKLQESHEQYRLLLAYQTDLIIKTDPAGNCLFVSPSCCKLLGQDEQTLLGGTVWSLINQQKENDQAHYAMMALETMPHNSDFEHRLFVQNQWYWFNWVTSAILDQNDEITAVIWVGRDITKRKQLELAIKENFEVYQAAINTTALGFWVLNTEGQFLEVNDAYSLYSGYSRQELLTMSIADVEANETATEIVAHRINLMNNGYERFRTMHRRKNGSFWPVEIVTSFSPIQGGRFFVFLEDLTDTIANEHQLELAAQILSRMSQAVVVTDATYRIISANPATEQMTGFTHQELLGNSPGVFDAGRHPPEFYRDFWKSLEENGQWEGETWDRHKSGRAYPVWLMVNAITDQQGDIDQYIWIFSDITERKKAEELIWKQANYDPLTGLANRALFQNRLQEELNHRARVDDALAVVYLDLDGFKDINDSFGHPVGDDLLIEVAHRLAERVRKHDTIARLGGDEFSILVTDLKQPEQIGSLARSILETLRTPIILKNQEVRIGASIGIALYPNDGETMADLIKHADVAMYQAKASGKNQFRFFQYDMNSKAIERLELIRALHQTVEKQAFQVYYQPKIRLADQIVVGMEALIRWPLENGQLLSPVRFIPCAEEIGLIVPMGDWLLAEVCRHTAAWNSQFNSELRVAVNLSALQFRDRCLCDKILQTLNQQGLATHHLELEVTESMLIENVEAVIETMAQLRASGLFIAIDDFGTGYSSLGYLKHFPISTLKIDRSFIHELRENSKDIAIVEAIIALANNLNLEVVAEGIETEQQMTFLTQRHCQMAQGYYIGRPMPCKQFEAFLHAQSDRLIRNP
jgi:diguanylate cyclase (GGDEF)-like protein/PAS domain S-box-containing protein